jgi:hypothetical protein
MEKIYCHPEPDGKNDPGKEDTGKIEVAFKSLIKIYAVGAKKI